MPLVKLVATPVLFSTYIYQQNAAEPPAVYRNLQPDLQQRSRAHCAFVKSLEILRRHGLMRFTTVFESSTKSLELSRRYLELVVHVARRAKAMRYRGLLIRLVLFVSDWWP